MEILHIHRYLSEEASAEEKREMERWLKQSEENKNLFESYQKIYQVKIRYTYQYDLENALNKFRKVMDGESVPAPHSKLKKIGKTGKRPLKKRLWIKAAAFLIIALGISFYVFTTPGLFDDVVMEQPADGQTIETSAGEQMAFRLHDGTRIRLNASSSIHIPAGYGLHEREVRLSGEAFFEVVNQPDLEFFVETDAARISVLGTSFGVRAWKEWDESVVAVQTGKVSVRSSDPHIADQTILNSGQYSTVRLGEAPGPAQHKNIEQYLGWTQQMFVFEDTPLRDVLHQLERHFNVKITMQDSSAIEDPVTARYRSESLDEILRFTSITHGVEFSVEILTNNNNNQQQ